MHRGPMEDIARIFVEKNDLLGGEIRNGEGFASRRVPVVSIGSEHVRPLQY